MSTLELLLTKQSAGTKTWRETLEEIPQEQFVCSRVPAPPQSTKELTGACLRRGVRGARERKQAVSANGALVLMQMPAFLHREQEDGAAADAGCRRLSRIPFCGALKNLSAGNQSAGAAKLCAAPRRAALGASQCQPARGATETAWQLGGLSPAGPRSPTLYPCLSFPICTGRCSGGLGTVPAPCWNPFIQAQGGVCLSEREGRQ